MTQSLFERLGGTEGIKQIANDIVEIHLQNPAIATRFKAHDPDMLKNGAATFFISGTGGPDVYKGKNMVDTHKHMNISHQEFMAVCEDALLALQKNGVGQREQEEVLFVFFSMRDEIIGV